MIQPAHKLAASRRNLALGIVLGAAAVVAGCQTPAAPFDPFLAGRNTIPPPGTAVPAGAAPYYNAAPPTVTVPAPGATYTAPGAVPAAVPVAAPVISTPSTGAGQLPRGISVPQSSNPARGDGAQLAVWQKSDDATTTTSSSSSSAGLKAGNSSGDLTRAESAAPKRKIANASETASVQPASYEEQAREPPIRIIEPLATTAAATAEEKLVSESARRVAATESSAKAANSRKLPELTDFPPAASGERSQKW